MVQGPLLLEAGGMFAALAVAGWAARGLGQSVIPFYVVGGMLVSPAVAGAVGLPAIPEREFLTLFAELGIVLLLFFLGLEFSIDRLLESRRRITTAGAVDLVNLPVGAALGLALGWSALEAFVLGGVVYISSSAIITKSLIDQEWIANAESGPILGTLVFEDLFIAFYLSVLAALLGGGGQLGEAVADVGVAMGFLLVLLVAVYYGEALFDRLLDVDSKELFVVRVLAVAVLVGGVALEIGASEAVAAFFVGMGFSGTGHAHELEDLLTPLRDAFAAVFFFWIGVRTDPRLVAGVAVPLALAVLATTPSKLVTGYLGGRVYDLGHRRSTRVATAMVTRGEFSLIIAALAAGTGTGSVLTETIPALAVGYVLVMSILGSVAMGQADRLAALLDRRGADASPA